jgi:hypothetical protein
MPPQSGRKKKRYWLYSVFRTSATFFAEKTFTVRQVATDGTEVDAIKMTK